MCTCHSCSPPCFPLPDSEATFTVPLQSKSAPEDETVALECELSKPDQPVKWYKDGKEVVPSENVEVITEGTKQKLVIKGAKPEDAADYTVRLGNLSTEASLTIDGKTQQTTGRIWRVIHILPLKKMILTFPIFSQPTFYLPVICSHLVMPLFMKPHCDSYCNKYSFPMETYLPLTAF